MNLMKKSVLKWYYEVNFLNKLLSIYIIFNLILLGLLFFNTEYDVANIILTVFIIGLLYYIIHIRISIYELSKGNPYISSIKSTPSIRTRNLNMLKRLQYNWLSINKFFTITTKINALLGSLGFIVYVLGDTDLSFVGGSWLIPIQHSVIALLSVIILLERNDYYELKGRYLNEWVLHDRRIP